MGLARILYDTDTADAATITASSESGSLTAAKAVDDSPSIPWRATGDTAEWIKWDMGASTTITEVCIVGHNLTSAATVVLEGHTSDSWGTPDVSQTLEVVTDSDSVVLPKLTEFVSADAKQWWRITIADAANPDGYVELGRVKLGEYWEFTPRNILDGFGFPVRDGSEGADQPGRVSTFRTHPTFASPVTVDVDLTTMAQVKKWWTIFRKVGRTKPVNLTIDSDEPTWLSFYSTIVSGLPLSNRFVDYYRIGTLAFDEKVE